MEAVIQSQPIQQMLGQTSLSIDPSCGGYAAFVGIVRNHNHGRQVKELYYECYETLAKQELLSIMDEAAKKFGAAHCKVTHRIGTLAIGELAVLVEAWAPHRNEAFLASRYVIDELKHRAPIWKKEFYVDGDAEWTLCTHGQPNSKQDDGHKELHGH